MFSHEQARVFYDWWGAKQDWRSWDEDAAVADLIEHLSPGSAQAVIEFGCGTGRLGLSSSCVGDVRERRMGHSACAAYGKIWRAIRGAGRKKGASGHEHRGR
jgi:hypothetical protein